MTYFKKHLIVDYIIIIIKYIAAWVDIRSSGQNITKYILLSIVVVTVQLYCGHEHDEYYIG